MKPLKVKNIVNLGSHLKPQYYLHDKKDVQIPNEGPIRTIKQSSHLPKLETALQGAPEWCRMDTGRQSPPNRSHKCSSILHRSDKQEND